MENSKLWQTVLAELEVQVSKPSFATFFSKTSLVSFENEVATIGCPNPLIQKMIETRYYSLLKNILDKHTSSNNSLLFTIKKLEETKKEAGPLFEERESLPEAAHRAHLRPDFTFENFAVSSSNQVAYAAAQAVVKNPGSAYNPLFLYGGVGVGKTHLMQAIGQAILKKSPQLKLIYCTGEEFTNEIVEAIRQKNTNFFKSRYRGVELLLMDDIQFIAGKERVQEEFFHTFNALLRNGAEVVLTSDRSPSEIAKLEERLRSRFDGGLTIDISPPDFELRTAILLIKAKSLGINLPMDLAQFAAANIEDTRRLEGFLRRLLTEAEAKKIPISPDLAKSILGKTNGQPGADQKRKVSADEVLGAVANRFDLKISGLKGPKRDRALALARQTAMHFLRIDCGYPFAKIGEVLGGRDHTTIMHGVEKISALLPTNENLREDISWIKRKLWGQA
ncbi:chromosomal replication initiator protein DnaA [Candidatus Gottesmanbacteria bacterium]|nr:chromosomal replication initiator protein DnaA [Candidatus Gottesmanbacteria bacterium]